MIGRYQTHIIFLVVHPIPSPSHLHYPWPIWLSAALATVMSLVVELASPQTSCHWWSDDCHLRPFGGFHSHGGTPVAGWFVMENPNLKWMTWGYRHLEKPHLSLSIIRWAHARSQIHPASPDSQVSCALRCWISRGLFRIPGSLEHRWQGCFHAPHRAWIMAKRGKIVVAPWQFCIWIVSGHGNTLKTP